MSCDQTREYEAWVDLDDMHWHEDSLLQFNMHMGDTLQKYDLKLGVRNTNLYPFQNIWLLVSLDGPSGISFQDTLQLTLAKDDGQWLGERSANLYTMVKPLYSGVQFYKPGDYRIVVQHGMRQEYLEGIANVGFRIEQTD